MLLLLPAWGLLVVFVLAAALPLKGQSAAEAAVDVVHYRAQIEPDIKGKTLKGKVSVRFLVKADTLSAIQFNCGTLVVDGVQEAGKPLAFKQHDGWLVISLSAGKANIGREVEITYHGSPRYGINFYPDQDQVYTVFSTSQWLVCKDHPADKASLQLDLILPKHLKVVANGRLVASRILSNEKMLHQWQENIPMPSYTFGFAAGPFRELTGKYHNKGNQQVCLRYLSASFSDDELTRIFLDTPDMFRFFEEKAGMPYSGSVYTQVLAAGKVAQEMSGFTIIRESYGQEVLSDQRGIWLIAHELAHQWWGNAVTCQDWTHFWLNEGMATFMSAAYKEHRFGREEYLKDIEAAKARYLKVKEAEKDRSLVFPNWDHPSPEDRTLVYHKGAYVLHLLREEMGEKRFWQGIKAYTRTYWGKSVTTKDFQASMEKASGEDLSAFFARWVYLTKE